MTAFRRITDRFLSQRIFSSLVEGLGVGFLLLLLLSSCSTTNGIPEGDQLFVGLKKIQYDGDDGSNYAASTKEEIEAALATAPNGALFGSSYYRTRFAPGLWVWNLFSEGESGFSKWMTSTFGKAPVLMSQVNPELRASVAQSLLYKHGYFHGNVGYDVVTQKNPQKAKIAYYVDMGHLFTIDTLEYVGFPADADSLISATSDEALLHTGDPFNVADLDAERNRLALLFRNNGYYYYQTGYAGYLADTFAVPGRAQLRLQMENDVPDVAKRIWYIGHVNINLRKSSREQFTDSLVRRFFTLRYSRKEPPVAPRFIMSAMRIRPRRAYSYDSYLESISKLNATGLFSMIDMQFTPRPAGTEGSVSDSLDVTVNCTFDKPYDFYVETNFNGRTIGRVGPELKLGLTRRNAFHGGEKIDINLHGSYEWSTSGGSDMSNYNYGADASIEFPRIIAPFFNNNSPRLDSQGRRIRRRRFYSTPTTLVKLSTDIIRRPGYYKMHVNSGELTYRWQTSQSSRHEFSPLTVKYQFINSSTEEFDSIMAKNLYLAATMEDYCIPEMRYTYTYSSPSTLRNPIRWETTVAESGNLTSLAFMALGRGSWNEVDKKLFKNPYSQFIRLETDFTKTWTLNSLSQFVTHFNGGIIVPFGNSETIPLNEMFYVGGANSIRAYSVRSVGPGGYYDYFNNRQFSYIFQNGSFKLVFNAEYRRQLFGNLYGALFVDAGNVWNLNDLGYFSTDNDIEIEQAYQTIYANSKFRFTKFFDQLAVGTGIGLRYDLDFLVLRIDWGIGLHLPNETTDRSGYFNARSFSRDQTLHFAIGYPF